jgi:peptidoglycan/xylan/chitin deacetylase (PgdA/CDA1 family)
MVKIMGLLAAALAFSLSACATPGPSAAHEVPPAGKGIAITFDDLPYANRKAELAEVRRSTDSILRTLRRGRIKAVGFVNEDRLADTGDRNAGIAFLEQWLRAGMELGNHNYGHVGLQDTPLKEYEKAVLRGEKQESCLDARADLYATRGILSRRQDPIRR